MGKHTKRKPARLPKVAAGAAPVALLIGAPASALAAPTEVTLPDLTVPLDRLTPELLSPDRLTLPIGHHQDGRISRELTSDAEDGASVLRGSLDLTRHDVVEKSLGDTQTMSDFSEGIGAHYTGRDTADAGTVRENQTVKQAQKHALRLGDDVRAVTANEQRLGRSGSCDNGLSLSKATASDRDEKLLGGGESTQHGLWLPQGIDVLSENSEQVDTGTRRSAVLNTDGFPANGLNANGLNGSGRFMGDLGAALAARRSSSQAVDLGDAAAVGTSSEQHGSTELDDALDSGSLSGSLEDLLTGEYGQAHAVGGHAGPASAALATGQDAGLSHDGSDDSSDGSGQLSNSISGDLGIDHVAEVHGRTATSVRDQLPDQPAVAQGQSASAGVLDQPAAGATWTITDPPLDLH